MNVSILGFLWSVIGSIIKCKVRVNLIPSTYWTRTVDLVTYSALVCVGSGPQIPWSHSNLCLKQMTEFKPVTHFWYSKRSISHEVRISFLSLRLIKAVSQLTGLLHGSILILKTPNTIGLSRYDVRAVLPAKIVQLWHRSSSFFYYMNTDYLSNNNCAFWPSICYYLVFASI